MTTVVFDGRTIAADKAAWAGQTSTAVSKLYKVELCDEAARHYKHTTDGYKDFVYAATGLGGDVSKYLRFVARGVGVLSDIHSEYDLGLMLCIKTGRCYNVTASGELSLYTELPIAGGAGRDMGIVLLGAGMKAEEVILHIAKYSSASALGVDSYTLPDDVNYYGIK